MRKNAQERLNIFSFSSSLSRLLVQYLIGLKHGSKLYFYSMLGFSIGFSFSQLTYFTIFFFFFNFTELTSCEYFWQFIHKDTIDQIISIQPTNISKKLNVSYFKGCVIPFSQIGLFRETLNQV